MRRVALTLISLCLAATSQAQTLILCVDAGGHAAVEIACLRPISSPCQTLTLACDQNNCDRCCYDSCEDCHDVALGSDGTVQRLRYAAGNLPISEMPSSVQIPSFPAILEPLGEMPIIPSSFPVLRI